ncbi:MAG: hypothetical protein M1820_010745 [Bogoriella megaspora]|nr:MAG: hypothetical protein M1820_010745 [Bogoriella megaspora]
MAIGDVTAVLLFAAPLFAGALEYEIQLSSSPEPFAIKVSECFLQFTEEKLKLTRLPVDVDQPDWTDGPPVHNATSVRDYWIDEYKWIDVQADLNTRFHQYTVNISPGPDCTYCEDVPLHFVHHRSNRSDAIPLLFLHGWPGSFIEVGNIIAGLTSPADLSVPAFHIVAPSLPGYAFSPAPTKTGFGARAAAEAFNALMVAKLGYAKYVVQGGDIGAFVLRFLAGNHPESVVSALSNLWITPPTPGDKTRYYSNKSSPDEAFTIESYGKFENFSSGYRLEMQTQPLQLGYGLTDSPIGLAMWIYNFMHTGVDKYVWTAKDIITWTMMYWIPGPYSGERMYKELVKVKPLRIVVHQR